MDAALTQLLSVGVVWISFHCAGMCGPIVGGLLGGKATSPLAAVRGLLLYQTGRALVLSLLGALAGAVGATFERALARGGSVLTLGLAVIMLLSVVPARRAGLVDLGRPRGVGRVRAAIEAGFARFSERLAQVTALVDARVGRRPLVLGMVLAFLPCMIIAWGLSLAASTNSAWHGARVMALLIAMTTVPLFASVALVAFTRARAASSSWRRLAAAMRVVPVVASGVWLMLVGLAGLGVIQHAHLVVDLFGPRTIMFW